MNWDALTGLISGASFDSGAMISPAQARRFLCDAQVIPLILGSKSEVLDVGRASRTFPAHIRRAITARDEGCSWPDCDRPPDWCDGHHIDSGSETSATPAMPTGVYFVRTIIRRFTNSNGSSRSRRTAPPSSSRRNGLIPCNDHAATPYENRLALMAKPCRQLRRSRISRHSWIGSTATRTNWPAVGRPESAIRVRPEF